MLDIVELATAAGGSRSMHSTLEPSDWSPSNPSSRRHPRVFGGSGGWGQMGGASGTENALMQTRVRRILPYTVMETSPTPSGKPQQFATARSHVGRVASPESCLPLETVPTYLAASVHRERSIGAPGGHGFVVCVPFRQLAVSSPRTNQSL